MARAARGTTDMGLVGGEVGTAKAMVRRGTIPTRTGLAEAEGAGTIIPSSSCAARQATMTIHTAPQTTTRTVPTIKTCPGLPTTTTLMAPLTRLFTVSPIPTPTALPPTTSTRTDPTTKTRMGSLTRSPMVSPLTTSTALNNKSNSYGSSNNNSGTATHQSSGKSGDWADKCFAYAANKVGYNIVRSLSVFSFRWYGYYGCVAPLAPVA